MKPKSDFEPLPEVQWIPSHLKPAPPPSFPPPNNAPGLPPQLVQMQFHSSYNHVPQFTGQPFYSGHVSAPPMNASMNVSLFSVDFYMFRITSL